VTDDAIINESTPTNPNTFYGAAKLFCEQLVRIYCQEAGIRSSVVRLGHIYGPGEEAYSKLIPVVIQKLLAGEPPTLVGSGNELRDFLYVQDAVRAIIQAAIVDTEHLGPINIVRGESIKVRDLLETLVQLCDCDREIQSTNSASPGVSYRFDSTLMQRTLKLDKLTDFHHGLQDEINYLRRKSA
jgi:nucleoside-diphosphate-sugar epimerase